MTPGSPSPTARPSKKCRRTFEGQIYKFPFDTEKKSYDVWDGPTRRGLEATYEGEESIEGTSVYKFVQVIEPTVIDTRDVPGSVFGSDEADGRRPTWSTR